MLPNQSLFNSGYTPSFDFGIFEVPNFSPLQANEFGAFTEFSANTPTAFVDYSLDQLLGILRTPNPQAYASNPFTGDNDLRNLLTFFQGERNRSMQGLPTGAETVERAIIEAEVERNRQAVDRAKGEYDSILKQRTGCNIADLLSGNCKPAILTPEGKARPLEKDETMISDGKGVLGKSFGDFFKLLPEGSGIFLLGLVALIFLFLFVRK